MAAKRTAAKKTAAPVIDEGLDAASTDVAATVASTVPESEPVASGKGSVIVTWRGGTRVYSKEAHGADFKALAAEFAEKKGGTVA